MEKQFAEELKRRKEEGSESRKKRLRETYGALFDIEKFNDGIENVDL